MNFNPLAIFSPKSAEVAIETASKGIYNGLDKLKFTEEERADAYQKGFETVLQFHKAFAAENTVRSVTRRFLAWGIVGYQLAVLSLGIAAKLWMDEPKTAQYIFEVAELLNWPFLAVVTTYFVPHQLTKLRGKG